MRAARAGELSAPALRRARGPRARRSPGSAGPCTATSPAAATPTCGSSYTAGGGPHLRGPGAARTPRCLPPAGAEPRRPGAAHPRRRPPLRPQPRLVRARRSPRRRPRSRRSSRYPPVVFVDQHEEGGHRLLLPAQRRPDPPRGLRRRPDGDQRRRRPAAAQGVRRRAHLGFTNYDTYDLFFMGYGDTVPSTLFGAAGMTFEKGGAAALSAQGGRALLAADTTLSRRGRTAGARCCRAGRGSGARRARRAPPASCSPTASCSRATRSASRCPIDTVYGYALRADAHAGDAAALARRLARAGVHVVRLTAPLAVPASARLRREPTAAATLPAGTYVVAHAPRRPSTGSRRCSARTPTCRSPTSTTSARGRTRCSWASPAARSTTPLSIRPVPRPRSGPRTGRPRRPRPRRRYGSPRLPGARPSSPSRCCGRASRSRAPPDGGFAAPRRRATVAAGGGGPRRAAGGP